MIVFTLLFGRLAHVPADGMPYPIFVYAGLLPWTFFNGAVVNATTSLVGNSLLITKVYFPRLVIPGAAVAAGLLDFAISTLILGCLMFYYHVHASWHLLFLPVLVLLTTMLTFALGLWMSALNVRYRDLRYALPFALQILLYLTPVIYPVSFIPRAYRWALVLNPLSGLIEGYRSAFLGLPFHWAGLGLAAAAAAAMLALATHSFRKMERELADII
jgi:lipopolysaccharide transport system permease protein